MLPLNVSIFVNVYLHSIMRRSLLAHFCHITKMDNVERPRQPAIRSPVILEVLELCLRELTPSLDVAYLEPWLILHHLAFIQHIPYSYLTPTRLCSCDLLIRKQLPRPCQLHCFCLCQIRLHRYRCNQVACLQSHLPDPLLTISSTASKGDGSSYARFPFRFIPDRELRITGLSSIRGCSTDRGEAVAYFDCIYQLLSYVPRSLTRSEALPAYSGAPSTR